MTVHFSSFRFLRCSLFFATLVLLAPASFSAFAQEQMSERPAISFVIPLACTPGQDCFVQNYVDVDPSRRWRDFKCRGLTYDQHKGTDFRLPSMAEMEKGVAVYAAADGRIKGYRDGENDGDFFYGKRLAALGKECGNGIIIDHLNGWETQYCHLKKGSVRVSRGQKVKAGDKIGLVGLSGKTEFTHLHFEARYKGATVDPFTGGAVLDGCGLNTDSLWTREARAFLEYRPTGLLNQGMATTPPDNTSIEEGAFTALTFSPDAPALIYFVRIFGLHNRDLQELTLTGPDGEILARQSKVHDGTNKAQFFQYIGKPRPQGGWPEGTYRASYRLTRLGLAIIDSSLTFEVTADGEDDPLQPGEGVTTETE